MVVELVWVFYVGFIVFFYFGWVESLGGELMLIVCFIYLLVIYFFGFYVVVLLIFYFVCDVVCVEQEFEEKSEDLVDFEVFYCDVIELMISGLVMIDFVGNVISINCVGCSILDVDIESIVGS